jgi:hypothetical protein
MRNIYIVIFYSLVLVLTACNKNNTPPALADSSITLQQASGKDTLVMPLSVASDSTLVIGLQAALSGLTSSADHWINFAVDTTQITAYRAKYGDAYLMPFNSYFSYRLMTRISAGSSISDSAQINILHETALRGYATYVLPVIIQSVDGKTGGPATTRVLYLVFKTGKPTILLKDGWTIAGFSSSYSTFVPANVLDNNTTGTYWTSNITLQMPQWIAINFNTTLTFSAVTFTVPTLLKYPTQGGYPTSIQIETSMDGTTWVSNGIYAGNISATTYMQTISTGNVTGKYLRFTALSCVKYASTYSCIFISDIGLLP